MDITAGSCSKWKLGWSRTVFTCHVGTFSFKNSLLETSYHRRHSVLQHHTFTEEQLMLKTAPVLALFPCDHGGGSGQSPPDDGSDNNTQNHAAYYDHYLLLWSVYHEG